MKFKILFLLALTFINSELYSQKSITQYEFSFVAELDQALLTKDLPKLQMILHENLNLGHSNGWIETKESLLKNLPTSKVSYRQFVPKGNLEIHHQAENLISLRRKITAIGTYEEKEFKVDLNLLEIWIREDENWKLLARQSVEMNFED